MALKTFVKINRVTNLTDARYCAGMHVNVMGFCLESDSAHFLSPIQFAEITGWISGIDFAAEFKNSSAAEVKEILGHYPGISWLESESLSTIFDLQETGMKLLYRVSIEEARIWQEETMKNLRSADISVHLTTQSEKLSAENLEFIRSLSKYCQVILGFGVDPETVNSLLSIESISGFALDSGDEIKPGLRDFDQLADILECLETED
jgi:phosphoribosylanthranilate isomerase